MARDNIDKLQAAADEVVSLVRDLEDEIGELKKENKELDDRLDVVRNDFESANDRIKELENELADAQGKSLESTPATLYG